jgi:hypothetical protein
MRNMAREGVVGTQPPFLAVQAPASLLFVFTFARTSGSFGKTDKDNLSELEKNFIKQSRDPRNADISPCGFPYHPPVFSWPRTGSARLQHVRLAIMGVRLLTASAHRTDCPTRLGFVVHLR